MTATDIAETALVSDTVTTIFLAFCAFLLIAACATTWLTQYGDEALAWLIAHPIHHPHFTWPAFSLPALLPGDLREPGHHRYVKESPMAETDYEGRHRWHTGLTGMFPHVVQLPLDPTTVVVDGEVVAEQRELVSAERAA